MSLNIVTIEIDTESDTPVKISKPEELIKSFDNQDDLLKNDIKDITWASIYMASILSKEDEIGMLVGITELIKDRIDEIERGS